MFLPGHHFDACSSVAQVYYAYHAPLFFALRLRLLNGGKSLRDSNMAIALLVDTNHHLPKQTPVRGGVVEVMIADVVMNHFVQNRIFHHLLGQVNARVDMQNKIAVSNLAKHPLSRLSVRYLAQEALGIAQSDRYFRQRIAKVQLVVFQKLTLYICHRYHHLSASSG